jgi:glycosyltransferase involved in cell wall biosynthesis
VKVLMVITESEKGGAQVHVLDLISGCREHCEMALATGDVGYLTQEAEASGIPTYIIPGLVRSVSLWGDLKATLGLIRLIRRLQPDVVHTHTYKAGLLGRLASFLCRVPVVYTAHTWCFQPGTGVWWKKLGLLGEWMSAWLSFRIITVSDANKAMALSFKVGSEGTIQTIHNGVCDVGIRARPEESPPSIVMVARFVIQKDQMSLIRALAEVEGEWRLRLIGDGPTYEEVREKVDELGLTNRVEFLGERGDVPQLLADASIFALITHLEGLPLAILEAMRASLPVVASDVGGVRETIDDGRTGYLIPHGDTEALRARLQTLIDDSALRRRLGEAGRQKYERHFGYSAMIGKTMDIYRAACRARSRPRPPRSNLVTVSASESRHDSEN